MDEQLRELTRNMRYFPGASDSAIASLQQNMRLKFPSQYLDFMRVANGAEGMVGSHYLALLPIEELSIHNMELDVGGLAPGLIIFADNGAGTAYAFDTGFDDYPIFSVPYVGLSREEAQFVAPTFNGFLVVLSKD